MQKIKSIISVAGLCITFFSVFGQNKNENSETKRGTVITETLNSAILKENRIGIDPNRYIKVYLPPGYADSRNAYPVIFYFHNIFWSAEKMFAENHLEKILDRGFAEKIVGDFILVAADFSTPTTGCIYENSPISGCWLDFTTQELVPFIDNTFRTIRHRNSRALIGDGMGGRGALKLAMEHADLFSVVYALHPVATGIGQLPWFYTPIDWSKIHQGKTYSDLGSDTRTHLFVTICQAFLPNPSRPPFFCDFYTEMVNGVLKFDPEKVQKTKAGFLLEETLKESAANLRTMRGIAFDWGRYDQVQAHIYANQGFSRKLEDLGIEHEAEEYRGNPWDRTWTDNGRFYTRVLPFLARHLQFEQTNK